MKKLQIKHQKYGIAAYDFSLLLLFSKKLFVKEAKNAANEFIISTEQTEGNMILFIFFLLRIRKKKLNILYDENQKLHSVGFSTLKVFLEEKEGS